MHVEEFRRMNANVKIEGRSVIVEGNTKLQGAQVQATDLRAAAALIIAGLCAEGTTEVTELKHLDRGYVNFEIGRASCRERVEIGGVDDVMYKKRARKSKYQRG